MDIEKLKEDTDDRKQRTIYSRGGGPVLADSGFSRTDDITYDIDTKTVTCLKSTSGYGSRWCSKSGFKDDIFFTFKPTQNTAKFSAIFEEYINSPVNYGFICNHAETSQLLIYKNGTVVNPPAGHTTYAVGDELRLEYSGGYVRYYHNGTLIYSIARTIGDPLYIDVNFYNSGSVYDLYFGTGLGNSKGVTLFEGSTKNDTGTITLSDSVLNYRYIDIIFRTNNEWAFQRVPREWLISHISSTTPYYICQYICAGSAAGQTNWPPTYNSACNIGFNSETEIAYSVLYHNANYICRLRQVIGYP